jgi:hypothetical protein
MGDERRTFGAGWHAFAALQALDIASRDEKGRESMAHLHKRKRQ